MTREPVGAFASGQDLARWTAGILQARGIDAIADWRMLEYWMNVELYGAVQAGAAGDWRHLGFYEQPYKTRFKIPGRKSSTKWIDLLVAWPSPSAPEHVLWIELKDLGRNPKTVKANAGGLGKDLAALWGIERQPTLAQFRKQESLAVDRGRGDEWLNLAQCLESAHWWFGQIVIARRDVCEDACVDVEGLWITAFEKRLKDNEPPKLPPRSPRIIRESTSRFDVYVLVEKLPSAMTV